MADPSRLDLLRTELAAPHVHPDEAELRRSTGQVLDWVVRHWTTLDRQPVGRTAGRAEMDARLHEPPPEHGQDFAAVLRQFQNDVAPFAFRLNHPRFLAFIPSAPTFFSVLGDMLCAGTNFFAGVWLEAAGPAEVELVVLDWLRQLLGLPAEARGLLTGGGSEANLTALLVARERLPFDDRRRAVLYVAEQRHSSVDRAARIIGLHPDQVSRLPADEQLRLSPAGLAEAVRRDRAGGRLPWAVVANAGATNTGAVDPLRATAAVCRENGLWLHVDAAYGWPAVLIPEGRAALDGVELADSITLDPHKWFGQTIDAGCVLVRDGRQLVDAFAVRPDYLQDTEPADDQVNFADHGVALTRRFRALKIWLSVKVLGLAWFRELVWRCCRLAELSQLLLERAGCFEILAERQLSVICFRYRPAGWARSETELDRINLALAEELRATGTAFLSSTRLAGRVALRFCFVNWRTTAGDVEEVAKRLSELAERVVG